MKDLGFDTKKMPLGKLSVKNIEKGFSILKDISDVLDSGRKDHNKLANLSSDFYSYIPHDFGF